MSAFDCTGSRFPVEMTIARLGERKHPRFRKGDAERWSSAARAGDLELPRSGAECRDAGEQEGAWDLGRAARDHCDAPV